MEEVQERGTEASPMVIAVAVKEGTNTKYAVMWALEQFMSQGQTLILLHVRPRVLAIPREEHHLPISMLSKDEVAAYMEEVDTKTDAMFFQYHLLCEKKKVNTMLVVVEEDDVASAIVQQISNYGISKLVLGSSLNARFKGIDVPATVEKNAPSFCAVYEISEGTLASVHSASSTVFKTGSPEDLRDHSSSSSDISNSNSPKTVDTAIFSDSLRGGHENDNVSRDFETASTSEKVNEPLSQIQNNIMIELEELRIEHKHTLGMFAVAREEAIDAKIKANELALQRIQEARKFAEAKVREEMARTIAAQEKEKSQEAMRQVEIARQLAQREAQQRRDAELRATTESEERKKAQEALASTHQGYRIYSIEEIQSATDFLSESLKIGEGRYGAVYKGNLQHTTVAIKVLRSEATQGIQQQFQWELEVLSRIRHPHLVLLLGACPEHRCLVYEYMTNGSLEDRLHCKGNSPPLPWFSRFRVAWEVASALLFLHSAKPKPIIHGDLKPANILLDHNFVSKIGDVALARLVPTKTTTMVTEYKDTVPAGTFCYIDPEYQRTGICVPLSDLYALGILFLQLLTAKPPVALAHAVERAIENDSFQQILDRNAGDWPLKEALELAMLGLKCAELWCRDRPDLEKDVLPALERFKALADAETIRTREKSDVVPPSHFVCPILEEIMEDPHFTADGYTYEYGAIKEWLEKSITSPMTNLPLNHNHLIPNHSLRSAILEWKIKYGTNNSNL